MRILKQISLLIFASVVWAGCGKPTEEKAVAIPLKVNARKLTTSGMSEALAYSGTIEADNSVSLGFSVSGRVTSVFVQEGQHVSAGQLLASLETIDYQNNVLLAAAALEQAEDNFNRLNELFNKGSLPARDHLAAKVALSQAEVNKSIASKRLSDTKLYAPFSGIVTIKAIEKGATVSPGIMAFTIVKTDLVYAQISVSESEISRLAVGTEAAIAVPALQDTIAGKITIINPQADATTRSFTVKVRLANPKGRLLPGMLANIKISTNRQLDALTVPVESVVRDAEEITYVFVVDEKNRAIRKRVVIEGLLMNEIIVSEGLRLGDRVITQGQNQVKDGQIVSL